jgi:hypothetical protein
MEDSMEEMLSPNQEMKDMACLKFPKSQAQKVKVGQPITVTLNGKVVGVHEGMGPSMPNKEEMYSVDIEVSEIKGLEDNSADSEYKKLKEAQ